LRSDRNPLARIPIALQARRSLAKAALLAAGSY
jgi:hypothetical protein